jgi:hypothetical protein
VTRDERRDDDRGEDERGVEEALLREQVEYIGSGSRPL